jgi:hypothetical protein
MMAETLPENLPAEIQRLLCENRELRLRLEETDRSLQAARTELAASLGSKGVSLVDANEHKRTQGP